MQSRSIGALIAIWASPLLCISQDQLPMLQLHIDSEIPVNCIHLDSSGWRDYQGTTGFYVREAEDRFIAVSQKGECRTALDTTAIPSSTSYRASDIHIVDLAERVHGGVIAAAVWTPDENTPKPAIVTFNDDGTFDKLVFLQGTFFPTHVAEFSSGAGYLVAGYDNHGHVFQALVTSDGKILKPNVLASPADSATAEKPGSASNQVVMEAGLMQLVSGDDDAVYLYSAAKGRTVWRIRPDGNSTKIDLAPAVTPKGERTLPLGMFIFHSSLYLHEALVPESKSNDQVVALNRFLLSVYDRYTGALEHAYVNDATLGGNPVSLAPHEFYFLKATPQASGLLTFSLIKAVE